MALGDGNVFAWGSNKYRQLGPQVPIEVKQPTRLSETHGLYVRDIACGDSHMLIMTTAAAEEPSMFNFDDTAFEDSIVIEDNLTRRINTEGSTLTPGRTLERQPSWGLFRPSSDDKVLVTEPGMGFKR